MSSLLMVTNRSYDVLQPDQDKPLRFLLNLNDNTDQEKKGGTQHRGYHNICSLNFEISYIGNPI